MIFSYKDSIQLDTIEILETCNSLETYRKQLREIADSSIYIAPESSLCLSRDTEYAHRIESLAAKFINPQLKYVIVIGIGGSSLGTKAIYEALRYMYSDTPQLIFLETIDELKLRYVKGLLQSLQSEPDQFVINIIMKSGKTTEPIFNVEYLLQDLDIDRVSERIIVTTDEDSPLWNLAGDLHFHRLSIPHPVGGRYSVLSAVGQFPLHLAGVEITSLLNGARAALDTNVSDMLEENTAVVTASILAKHYENGYKIFDTFIFAPELEALGKWYRQLMAESLGKSNNSNEHICITPTISIGTDDLHSLFQLYIGGGNQRVTHFVRIKPEHAQPIYGNYLRTLLPELHNKTSDDVLAAIFSAVTTQYNQNDLPYTVSTFEARSEYELGFFMQTQMISIMYLGKLLEVNAFNQPDVEWYKQETRRLLGTNG